VKIIKQLVSNIAQLHHVGEAQLFQFGLPLPPGQVENLASLCITQNDAELPLSAEARAYWPDGSVRWAWCQTHVASSGPITSHIKDSISDEQAMHSEQAHSELWIQPKAESDTNNILFTVPLEQLTASVVLKLKGDANPHAAAHDGGQWDLGDIGSALIDELSFVINSSNATPELVIADAGSSESSASTHHGVFSLRQNSSGGEHWQSPIHWDKNRQSTVVDHGFQVRDAQEVLAEGLRAEPVAYLAREKNRIEVALEDFWQNFPTVLDGENGSLVWKVFSSDTELQGGESKSWQFRCRVISSETATSAASAGTSYADKITLSYDPDYLNACQILPHIAFSCADSELSDLIKKGLTGDSNFHVKREQIDVYGWRHYGELYADHEVSDSSVPYFISHYNNQYDPLMGFTLQYLHSGDSAWLDLSQPLSRHVQDIDIYDTEEDKAEYNGGPFWHTDHYLSAETCTHRSNSKYHTAAYDGFLGGGGPGGQHCYTTGLALQYFLFGDDHARQKVAQICDWIRCFYNGSGSLAERTFWLLTMDFKQDQLTNLGIKAPGYRYPLDRGTGYFLTALIDHYSVSEKSELITEMGSVIRQTCHPQEDINLRNLHDAENAWFYTVFFQSVVQYLLLKESLGDIDSDYWYARHSLMHFCEWMLENETFYLDKPEQLEFPNDTWCAQELRKSNLFYFAYYFSEHEEDAYLTRAEEFYRYVTQRLQDSKEGQQTRVLALMMQNDGVRQKFLSKPRSDVEFESGQYAAAPTFSPLRIVRTYLSDSAQILTKFSIKAEWNWISIRLGRLGLKK